MKIGDIVYNPKIRHGEHATIVKAEISVKYKEDKNKKLKKVTESKYIAKFEDGSEMTFYGFNVNKSVFLYVKPDGQLSFDFMHPPIEE